MELLDRYIHEVGRHLPKQQREDVRKELLSLLADMVEDRAQTNVENADEEIIVSVLREFGRPEEVALSYQPDDNYLIGPELYSSFINVIRIVAIVIAALYLIGAAIALQDASIAIRDLGQIFKDGILNYAQSTLTGLSLVILIFAVLEKIMPTQKNSHIKVWDPRDLPPLSDASRINRLSIIWYIVGTVFALVIFNLFPEKIGINSYRNGVWLNTPIMSAELLDNLVPWLNVLWVAVIGYHLYLLRQTNWSLGTRVLQVALNILPLFVFYIFIIRDPVYNQLQMGAGNIDIQLEKLFPLLILVILFGAGRNIYKMYQGPKSTLKLMG